MREININELATIHGGRISIGKLAGGLVMGAIGGLIRGIPGGPAMMIGSAIAGAGLAAAAVATSDAADIHDKLLKQPF